MKVHQDSLGDAARFIAERASVPLQEKREQYEAIVRQIRLIRPFDSSAELLEVGTGTGWFLVLCAMDGIPSSGLEISPQLVDCTNQMAANHGVKVNVQLGNLEDVDLGVERYDVIIAKSVFEHVEYWEKGLEKLYRALRPGGVFIFESTNKFALESGEYPAIPIYGWFPDFVRYRFRMMVHGRDIMKLGIDFHQFTYPRLRRALKKIGYKRVLDQVDMANLADKPTGLKRKVILISRKFRLVRHVVLSFMPVTNFVCGK